MLNVFSRIRSLCSPRAQPLGRCVSEQYAPLYPNVLKTVQNVQSIGSTIREGRWALFSGPNVPSKQIRKADYAKLKRHLQIANSMHAKAVSKFTKHGIRDQNATPSPSIYQLRLRLNMDDSTKARRAEMAVGEILDKYSALLHEHEQIATTRFGPSVNGPQKWHVIAPGLSQLDNLRKSRQASMQVDPDTRGGKTDREFG